MESVIERYLRCWNDVFVLARRPAAFVPFVLIAAAKSALLLSMYFFWHPVLSGFMTPALRTLGGERVLHFPTHAQALPEMFQAMEIAVMVLFGFAMTVWAVCVMADTLEGKKRGLGLYGAQVALLTPSLVVMALVFAGSTIGVPMVLNWGAEKMEDHRPKLQLLLIVSAFGAAFLARVFLAYAPCFVRAVKGGAIPAIRKSVGFCREHFALTMLIVATAMIPEKALEYVASDTSVFLKNSRAEWIPVFLFVKIVIEVFAWFFWVGAVTSKAADGTPA